MRRVALAVLLAARVAGGAEPVVPKLDPPAPPPARADEAPARALPPTVAVCRDPASRRCWTAPTAADCGGVDAVYRVVIATPGRTDRDEALASCRAEATDGAAR